MSTDIEESFVRVEPCAAELLPVHVVDDKVYGGVDADEEMAQPGDDVAEAFQLALVIIVDVSADDQLVEIGQDLEALTSDEDGRESDEDDAQVVLLTVLLRDAPRRAGVAVPRLQPGALGREERLSSALLLLLLLLLLLSLAQGVEIVAGDVVSLLLLLLLLLRLLGPRRLPVSFSGARWTTSRVSRAPTKATTPLPSPWPLSSKAFLSPRVVLSTASEMRWRWCSLTTHTPPRHGGRGAKGERARKGTKGIRVQGSVRHPPVGARGHVDKAHSACREQHVRTRIQGSPFGDIRVFAENLDLVGFLAVCFLHKINPNPRNNICCGKKWPKCHLLT